MISCCQYCYVKFRNEDGSVDREELEAWAISLLKEKNANKKQSPELSEIEELIQKCIDGACSCPCHIVGSRILY